MAGRKRNSVASRRRYFTRGRFHHKKKFTLPLAIVGGFFPLVMNLKDGYNVEGFSGVLDRLPGVFGVETNGKFVGWRVMQMRGVPSILAGFAAHWIASKVGINRMLGRAGIPFVRI